MDNQKKKTSQKTTLTHDLLALLMKILVIILLFVLMFTFLFGLTRYNSLAMDPNIQDGDLVLYYRLDKDYVATDVCALQYNDQTLVLRVVAVAGDTVDMTDQGFVINGNLQSEPDKNQVTLPFTDGVDFPITLQEGEIFVLGDNRGSSTDSRLFGVINEKDTLGEIMSVIRRRNF